MRSPHHRTELSTDQLAKPWLAVCCPGARFKAPLDRMGAEIIRLLWEWDAERITNIKIGTHPEGSKAVNTKTR